MKAAVISLGSKSSKMIAEEMETYFDSVDELNLKKIELVPSEWSVESGDLTPTLKLKRKIILARYDDVVNTIYS